VKWLTAAGAAAALAVGTATVMGVGWRGVLLLLAFLVSGSLWTKGGGRRTAAQVFANGGVAAAAALLGSWPAFAGAIAAAASDTWATEIGAHSRTAPRLITNGTAVPPGTNGGITILGTAGGVLGAVLIAGLTYALSPRGTAPGLTHPGHLAVVVAVAGVLGMLIDSLLGATVQGPNDKWLNNNGVNLAMTLAGAGIAAWLV
jgi:uncharacterized protein (TIGR00297 family)